MTAASAVARGYTALRCKSLFRHGKCGLSRFTLITGESMRLVVLLMLFLAGSAQALELHIALGVPSGQGNGSSGGLVSFNDDLAHEICRRLSARCMTNNVQFAEILPGIESGRFDLGFGNFLRTPERVRRVDFSAGIWRSSSRLIARRPVAERFTMLLGGEPTLDNLRHARVLAVDQTQQYRYLGSQAEERGLQLTAVQTLGEGMDRLRQGQADFFLLPVLSAYAMISGQADGDVEFVGPPVTEHGLGGTVHIALPKGRDDLRHSVDQAIAALRADGTYTRIVRRYFPFNLD